MGDDAGEWPTLSGPHRDGGRHVGIRVLPEAARLLNERGFIVANKMYEKSGNEAAIASVRVGDVLDVRFDGERGWWVWRNELRLGRLTWSPSTFEHRDGQDPLPRIDDGTLQVIRLFLDARGNVVNAGGIVRPRGTPVPPVHNAVPQVDVFAPTLRAEISADADVTVYAENLPGAPRAGSVPMPGARRSF